MKKSGLLAFMVTIAMTLSACGGGGGSDDKDKDGSDNSSNVETPDDGSAGETDLDGGDSAGGDEDGSTDTDGDKDDSDDVSAGGDTGGGPVTPTDNYESNGPAGVNAPDDRVSSGAGAHLTLFSYGVDTDHQEFDNLVVSGEYGVTGNNAAAFVASDDESGVGTYAAGLAVGKNVGIAPAAALNNVRVFGDPRDRTVGNTREALAYTIENLPTSVLLLGYEPNGDTYNAELTLELPAAATDKDWVVAISGRDVADTYPQNGTYGFALYADDPEYGGRMIVVGASDGEGELLDNSPTAYTPSSYQDDLGGHFIVAPGQSICSSGVPGGTDQPASVCDSRDADGNETVESSYFSASGTAPATALVAGAATAVRGLYPQLDAAQTVRVLLCSADDLGEPGYDIRFGAGRLNVQAAIALAQTIADGGDFGDCDVPEETPAIDSGEGGNDSTDLPFALNAQKPVAASIGPNPAPAGQSARGCTAFILDASGLLQFRDKRGDYSFSDSGCMVELN